MKTQPFIEAEQAAGHSVARCCVLLEVSRAAYYQRINPTPTTRQLSDTELTVKIGAIHDESNGTYGGTCQ